MEGTYHTTLDSPKVDAAASGPSLPANPPVLDAPQAVVSRVDTQQIADGSQHDVSVADVPMPDAPAYQATPELLTSTPPSKVWVVKSASAKAPSQASSPSSQSKVNTQEVRSPKIA